MQFSTSSRMRPNVCISDSTSNVSPGCECRYRRIPARRGDCTSVRNRASMSDGSDARTGAAATARRALKVKSSILVFTLSAGEVGSDRGARRTPGGAVVGILVLLNQRLHPNGVAFRMPVTADRAGAAARLDQHVGQQRAGINLHRRDVRDVDRLLL